MKKNVLFIFPQPDKLKETRFGVPLGLLYLSSELKNEGYNVELVDFNVKAYGIDFLKARLKDKSIVGISIPSYCLSNAIKIIRDIKLIDNNILIVAGGPDPILFPQLIEGTDATFISESESTVVDVFNRLLERRPLEKCKGIIYKDDKGLIHQSEDLNIEHDLNRIKFPDRSILESSSELGGSLIREPKLNKSTQIITTRGCPMHCRFCARHALSYSTYRERGISNVLDELELISSKGYKMVWISDDNFAANVPRAKNILQGVIEREIKLELAFSGWVKSADEELYILAKEAGVKIISFGLESGNQDVLEFYNKKITLDESKYAVELADKIGLFTVGNFILGAPIETKEHFNTTIQFALSLPLDTVNFKILGYMAGSSLWYEYVQKGLIRADERNVFADKNRGLGFYTLVELQQIIKVAETEFKENLHRKTRLYNKILKHGYPYEIKVSQ